MTNVGLVLSGGGARGAYQVGALVALSEMIGVKRSPFNVLAGISAGAINTVSLGVGADDFPSAADRLASVWSSLTPERVYRTDVPTLTRIGARWIVNLTTGGILEPSRSNYLLDTSPLRELLERNLHCARLSAHIDSGLLRGLAVSATNYLTGSTVTFYQAVSDVLPWVRRGRVAERQRLAVDHVLASAALPLFFPPVVIDERVYGDGGIRMTTPLGPAIHLGAQKILAVSVRVQRTPAHTIAMNREVRGRAVSAARLAGVLLNAVFLDALDNDFERLQRVNRTLGALSPEERKHNPDSLRRIPTLLLRPTRDLGHLAADQYEKFPATLRYLLRGIGATGDAGWELLSYVAFQPGYVNQLMDLGYQDTLARRAEVEAFFEAEVDD
jgi:NTE family protein